MKYAYHGIIALGFNCLPLLTTHTALTGLFFEAGSQRASARMRAHLCLVNIGAMLRDILRTCAWEYSRTNFEQIIYIYEYK